MMLRFCPDFLEHEAQLHPIWSCSPPGCTSNIAIRDELAVEFVFVIIKLFLQDLKSFDSVVSKFLSFTD